MTVWRPQEGAQGRPRGPKAGRPAPKKVATQKGRFFRKWRLTVHGRVLGASPWAHIQKSLHTKGPSTSSYRSERAPRSFLSKQGVEILKILPSSGPAGRLAGRLAGWPAGRPASRPASRPAGWPKPAETGWPAGQKRPKTGRKRPKPAGADQDTPANSRSTAHGGRLVMRPWPRDDLNRDAMPAMWRR